METRMLQRGDQLPHFEVMTLAGDVIKYSTVWQRSNLLLVTLPGARCGPGDEYALRLAASMPAFREHNTVCVITRDAVPGVPSPGVVVADRWGEIAHIVAESDVANLPVPRDLLEWTEYLQRQCPECQGEAK